jgi:1,4-dihydroxy-6-naphthoate synthase
MASRGSELDGALRSSIEYAFAHPDASRRYVAAHAQEMDPSVVASHIRLYVNDYTLALDEAAVNKLLGWAEEQGFNAAGASALPVFVGGTGL